MQDQCNADSTMRGQKRIKNASWWLLVIGLIGGIAMSRIFTGGVPVTARVIDAAATATRTAELVELESLRTKVAQPVVCTPAPTATPTSTPTSEPTATRVPAVQAGEAVPHGDAFIVTVLSIQTVAKPDGVDVTGQLLRVNFSLDNGADAPQPVPFLYWRLVDASGNRYAVNLEATRAVAGPLWATSLPAHATEERTIVFDVAPDAGATFVLESETDPGFRVELTIESRG